MIITREFPGIIVSGDRVELKQWDVDPIAGTKSIQSSLITRDSNQASLRWWIFPGQYQVFLRLL